MIEKRLAKVYRIHMMCDECHGLGEMRPTGNAYSTFDQHFEHRCTNCAATKIYTNASYPMTQYEDDREV